MIRFHAGAVWLVVCLAIGVCAPAGPACAQGVVEEPGWLEKHNPFRPFNPAQPITVTELCKRLDCVAEKIRDDGLIVLKQPDVFSQARMTRFRNDFEAQMSNDLGNFHLVLAARINRLDAATTTQTTALSAALAAPGTTSTTSAALPDLTKLNATPPAILPGSGTFDPTKGAFSTLSTAPNTLAGTGANAALGLGVDPTVYLDEKKRFLEHLNQVRRISLGPDQNDSSGYGLYLIRLPVSITPGEKTYQGFGAELALHLEHELPPDFLPTTFQDLVINDIVDRLGPVVYEAIRSGYYQNHLVPWHDAVERQKALQVRNKVRIDSLLGAFSQKLVNAAAGSSVPEVKDIPGKIVSGITSFIMAPATQLNGDPANDQAMLQLVAGRLSALADAAKLVTPSTLPMEEVALLQGQVDKIREGQDVDWRALKEQVYIDVQQFLLGSTIQLHHQQRSAAANPAVRTAWNGDLRLDMRLFKPFFSRLLQSALSKDADFLRDALDLPRNQPNDIVEQVASSNLETFLAFQKLKQGESRINLPSTRNAKQLYPIAPREVADFFGYENLYILATDATGASRTKEIRSSDVRNHLRQTLGSAYAALTYPTQKTAAGPGSAPPLLPLDDRDFMDRLIEALNQREIGEKPDGNPRALGMLEEELLGRVTAYRESVLKRPIAALCWAIVVDAALLDRALRADARDAFAAAEKPLPDWENVRLYHTKLYHRNIPGDPAIDFFNEYVRTRWPIVTFGLDPVSDQQNIADSYNLKRDLQLALSYAFATGQIGFSQLNTFRRQIEQSSDTIALNRTVTGFVHGNDAFGFRFTPRFQNPPNQRTNIGVITSQLISGGPGPDYAVKKSKLEAGMRELTAVVLAPTFLPRIRMDVTTNWFRLNDPEHLVFHTTRMMEQGRMVQELRQSVLDVCSSQRYRASDLRVLQSKLVMLEAMLPAQSKVMLLPFENSASGFDLLSDGATALVPELTGFSGVDSIQMPTAAATPGAASTSAPGLQVQTSTVFPTSVTTTSIVGGSSSLADVFVFGKYISLLDTKAIVGGRAAAFEILSREVVHIQVPANAIPTQTVDGDTYLEVFLATPNGISNSLFLPCKLPVTAPEPKVAYDLDTASLDVFYRWSDDKTALVASAAPSKGTLSIKWDSSTGFAPKRLQVTFQGTINNTPVSFAIAAAPDVKNNYTVDAKVLAATLLKRAKEALAASGATAVISPATFTVYVQPFLPRDTDEYRVQTDAKKLATPLTVNFYYQATGNDTQLGVQPVSQAPGRAGSPDLFRDRPAIASGSPRTKDDSFTLAAKLPGQVQLPASPPAEFDLPQLPPEMETRVLQSPNVQSEAEQVARMLTGQPSNSNRAPATTTTGLGGAPVSAQAVSTTTSTMAGTVAGGASIVVMPAPVVVLPPKPDLTGSKHKGQFRPGQSLRKLSNRLSQGGSLVPQQP